MTLNVFSLPVFNVNSNLGTKAQSEQNLKNLCRSKSSKSNKFRIVLHLLALNVLESEGILAKVYCDFSQNLLKHADYNKV